MVRSLFGSRRARRKKADEMYGDRLPAGQHTVTNWPVLTYGHTPNIAPEDWEFSITGLVEREFTVDFRTFLAAGSVVVHADFHCVTTFSVMDNDWGGVPVQAILEKAKPLPEAAAVMVHCYGGYTTNLLLEDLDRPENLFALRRNGEPLARARRPHAAHSPPSIRVEERQVGQRPSVPAERQTGFLGGQRVPHAR